ncbi:GDP-fucose protein O-fucosyltransferase 1-like [Antedon mediterranea]|uniref:GDP-fucose protein O-fucosyltransferase 1-like n=1 Tax=Antedon mediterranea TaxID=105859 RepID=UPI003AF84A43
MKKLKTMHSVATSYFIIFILWSLSLKVNPNQLEDIDIAADILADEHGTDTIEVSFIDSPGLKVGQAKAKLDIDPRGYLLYCPCMGRFGNQAEHLIGSLAFAKAIDRTLAIPPFRTYVNVPFTDWFQIDRMQEFHRVLTLEDFMEGLAPEIWPPGQRVGYCVLPASSTMKCEMKKGSPFGPFWDSFQIDFDDMERFSLQIHSDLSNSEITLNNLKEKWNERFPPSEYPVIALKGAPSPYPIPSGNRFIQKYMEWAIPVQNQMNETIQRLFKSEKFVAIHLRNGLDWVRACEHAAGARQFMASPQCHNPDEKTVTHDMCLPSEAEILTFTTKVIEQEGAKHLYIATDNNAYEKQFKEILEPKNIQVHTAASKLNLLQDLYFMSEADYFIGNCVSSVTSFVKRQRDGNGRRSNFFGLEES